MGNPPNSQESRVQQLPETCPSALAFYLLLGQRPGLQGQMVRQGLQELEWLFNCAMKVPSSVEFRVHTQRMITGVNSVNQVRKGEKKKARVPYVI